MKRSKYYYDYTRNMSVEQEMKVKEQNNCGRPTCEVGSCNKKNKCPKKKLTLWQRVKNSKWVFFLC